MKTEIRIFESIAIHNDTVDSKILGYHKTLQDAYIAFKEYELSSRSTDLRFVAKLCKGCFSESDVMDK